MKSSFNSVYCQHKRYLINKKQDLADPRTAFRRDFFQRLYSLKNQGDRLIICIDANDNLVGGKLHRGLCQLGLIPAICTRHRHQNPPPTYHRGSKLIDGIYTSPGFQITAAGYSSFTDSPGDHRALWIDINYTTLFTNKQKIPRPPFRRLSNANTRTTAKFTMTLKKNLTSTTFLKKANNILHLIHSSPSSTLTPPSKGTYEHLDTLLCDAMFLAEHSYRPNYQGKILWSPPVTYPGKKIKLFKLISKFHNKPGHPITCLLTRLCTQLHLSSSTIHRSPLQTLASLHKAVFN